MVGVASLPGLPLGKAGNYIPAVKMLLFYVVSAKREPFIPARDFQRFNNNILW